MMSNRKILITEDDMRRLRLLLGAPRQDRGRDRPYLETLETELDRATVVKPDEITPDVITMNSKVRIRIGSSGFETAFTIVFPEDAVPAEECISVLSPLGAALLGYGVGDRVPFSTPMGANTCEILKVLYQPETAGDVVL